MFEDAVDLETTFHVPDTSVVTQLGHQSAVHRLPVEILGKIFVDCIPPLGTSGPDRLPEFETHPRHIRATLAQVCRFWCTVLNNEPRVWGTLAIDYPKPKPEIVSLWLKKSKSCPLDVYIMPLEYPECSRDNPLLAISELLYNELPRIRSLFATDLFMETFSTLPDICDGHTIFPRMESLNLYDFDHCEEREETPPFFFPQLRSLFLMNFEMEIDRSSMQNVHHLDMVEYTYTVMEDEEGNELDTYEPCWSYQFLPIVPNLVSLTWTIRISSERLQPPVVLPSLKFLSLPEYSRRCWEPVLCALECFVAPSLENVDLDFGYAAHPPGEEVLLKKALDVICRDKSVKLRHLTVRDCSSMSVFCRAMSPHTNHLQTFTIYDRNGPHPIDMYSNTMETSVVVGHEIG